MFSAIKVQADEIYDGYDLGKTINLITSKISGFSVINNYQVFDLNKLYSNFDIYVNQDDSISYNSTIANESFEKFTEEYASNCGFKGECSYGYAASISNSINMSSTMNDIKHSKYYFSCAGVIDKTMEFNNLNEQDMMKCYNSLFISRIETAINNRDKNELFNIFDKYGTHVIIKASYGSTKELFAKYEVESRSTLNYIDNNISFEG